MKVTTGEWSVGRFSAQGLLEGVVKLLSWMEGPPRPRSFLFHTNDNVSLHQVRGGKGTPRSVAALPLNLSFLLFWLSLSSHPPMAPRASLLFCGNTSFLFFFAAKHEVSAFRVVIFRSLLLLLRTFGTAQTLTEECRGEAGPEPL